MRLVTMRTETHLAKQFARSDGTVEVLLPLSVQHDDVDAARPESEHSIREIRGIPDGAAAGVCLDLARPLSGSERSATEEVRTSHTACDEK